MQESVKKDREKFIGGSDVPAVMGISPFVSRFELLLQKAGIAEDHFQGNEYTRYGDTMEPKIRDYLNEIMPCDFKEDKRESDDIPIGRRYHADGYSESVGGLLEIKTTSQMHEKAEDYTVYLAQLLYGMEMFDCEDGLLAVYERPADFDEEFDPKRLCLYPIFAKDFVDLRAEIETHIGAFIDDLKAIKENPFLSEDELPSRRGIAPVAKKVEALEYQLAAFKELEKQYKAAKEELRVAMKENGIKTWITNNGVRLTLIADGKDTEVEKFDDKKFAEEHPRLWKQYQVRTVKKGAKGYVKITLPKVNSD